MTMRVSPSNPGLPRLSGSGPAIAAIGASRGSAATRAATPAVTSASVSMLRTLVAESFNPLTIQ